MSPPLPPTRGYTLLAITLILAALALVLAASLQYAYSERRNTIIVRDDVVARTIAEAGLERTLAYLAAIDASDVDLDRALDPNLDTQCARVNGALSVVGGQADDNLPVFTDGVTVSVPPSGHAYKQVAHAGGAYLVRIEDNDDDAMPGAPASTSNNAWSGCIEGPSIRQDPVRDRDRTVIVDVIGIYPGTSFATARARKALRVTVGPGRGAGVMAGGTVAFNGGAHVCGPYGDVMALGSVQGGCLCGPGCTSGGPLQACGTGDSCLARSNGPVCTASNGGAGGTCTANVPVDPPPMAFPWDRTNAPPPCVGATCTPFYYLRWNTQMNPATAQVFMWSYASQPRPVNAIRSCANPRAWPRICYPGDPTLLDCASCWVLFPGAVPVPQRPTDVMMVDGGALNGAIPILPTSPSPPLVWRAVPTPSPAASGCDADRGDPYPGPNGSGRASTEKPPVTFELRANGKTVPPTLLPHGLWFVEGNIRVVSDSPSCNVLSNTNPLWSASLISTGDFLDDANILTLLPAHPKGFVVLAGRDFAMENANGQLWTCRTSAAVMAHEQLMAVGNQHLQAQVVVENAATCSSTVQGREAVQLGGSATIEVPVVPPLGSARDATPLTWSESSD